MRARRFAAVVAVAAVAGALPASAALAHGSVQRPASRQFACGDEGGATADTAACKAARAAGDSADWDNLRIADVAGRDREVVPDGQLCSAGIRRYRGLDLARDDWPATRLRGGADITVRYRTTIPHRGTFRLYLTNDRYEPNRPLRWADLDRTPFASVTDPPQVGGAYTFHATIPTGRTGRQLIYTIWQNSSTADTYYSCSDVQLSAARTNTDKPAAPTRSAKARPARTRTAVPVPAADEPSAAAAITPTGAVGPDPARTAGILVIAAAAAGAAVFGWRRFGARRGPRRQTHWS